MAEKTNKEIISSLLEEGIEHFGLEETPLVFAQTETNKKILWYFKYHGLSCELFFRKKELSWHMDIFPRVYWELDN